MMTMQSVQYRQQGCAVDVVRRVHVRTDGICKTDVTMSRAGHRFGVKLKRLSKARLERGATCFPCSRLRASSCGNMCVWSHKLDTSIQAAGSGTCSMALFRICMPHRLRG